MCMSQYILHWIGGKTEKVCGYDIVDAFKRAGYGGGAIRALDYYEEVKNQDSFCCSDVKSKLE